MDTLISLSEVVHNLAIAIGVIVGGWWAYHRFSLGREGETRLDIDLDADVCWRYGDRSVVHLDTILTNRGNSVISARDYDVARAKGAYANEDDSFERHMFSCALELRQVPSQIREPGVIDWFSYQGFLTPLGFPPEEVNLIDCYDRNGKPDFWMEPSEVYHLGTTLVLSPGFYLAKVTFIGARRREYWTRVFPVSVSGPGGAYVCGEEDGSRGSD